MVVGINDRLISRAQSEFDELTSSSFGIFHQKAALFFEFVGSNEVIKTLFDKLESKYPDANEQARRYKFENDVRLQPQSRMEAAALGAGFIKLVSKEEIAPRTIYNNVFFNDN